MSFRLIVRFPPFIIINAMDAPDVNKSRAGQLPQKFPCRQFSLTCFGREGGYAHYQEKVDGRKVRQRSESFKDHYSQAKLFWNSMTEVEKEHIIEAFHFEVGKVKSKDVQQQVVEMFSNVDVELAKTIAMGVGVNPPANKSEVKWTWLLRL